MIPSFITARTNRARTLALLLSLLLLASALPAGSISRTAQSAARSTTEISTSEALQPLPEATATVNASQSLPGDGPTQEARIAEAFGKLPLSFEANEGQFDPQVQFMARGGGYGLFLTSTEAVLVLTRPVADQDNTGGTESPSALQAKIREAARSSRGSKESEATVRTEDGRATKDESTVLRIKLEGANSTALAQGIDLLPGKTNYFTGNDPKMWHTEIPSYARVMYREVYPGVDIIYYGQEQQLEYDFVVAPGSDANNISLGFEGAQRIEVDEQGDLVLHTAGGEAVRQGKPVVYQEIEGVKHEIGSRYVMKGSERVGFEMEEYDASKPLVIDPVLSYSTYLGGAGRDTGYSIAVDAAGNAYVAGATDSFNFPVVNHIQTGGGSEAFISKLNPDGSALVYSTYLGGRQGLDLINSIAVNSGGSAYVSGYTYAPDFPLVNPVQGTLGGFDDAFAARLSPSGSSLIYSTYLGGESYDAGYDVAVDSSGNAYVTGFVYSHDFATVNPFQTAKQGDQAFKSTDSGGNWVLSDTGLNAARINDVVINPASPAILYTASDLGVHKTTDGGNSWNTADAGVAEDVEGTELAIDPLQPSTIYLGTDTGMYKSTDSGGSWNGLPPFFSSIDELEVDPVNTSNIYASVGGAPYKSTNGGSTWSNLNGNADDPIGSVTSFAINPANNSIIYVGTAFDNGIYKSTDGGTNWSPINNGLPPDVVYITDLVINPSNPSILYAASSYDAGVYKSTNGGNSWSAANTGLPSPVEVSVLALDPAQPSTVYAGTYGAALFKSTDSGGTWSASETGLTNKVITDIAIDPTATSKVYVGTNSRADGFLTKLSPTGSMLFSTYLGGNEHDLVDGLALDSDGNIYLTGLTASTNFPTMNPLQAALASPDSMTSDAFVTKLDAAGSSLIYSTYLGGNDSEQGTAIAIDSAGQAYVTGFAIQNGLAPMTFPTTPGAFQTAFNGYIDAFVTKINAAGSSLTYSTYLGGDSWDAAYGIAVNSTGQAFVVGKTQSGNFPVASPTQPLFHNYSDAFVTRLNTVGSALIFSTYLGGNGFDFSEEGRGIAVDPDSNIYVTGGTNTPDFPTVNAVQPFRAGNRDIFISKFSLPPSSVQISGRVKLGSNTGLAGVKITLTGGAGFTPRTAMTPGSGSFSFNDLPPGRNYTLMPSKLGYEFNPTSRSLTNVRINMTLQDFNAVARTYAIQGRVTGIGEFGVGGVKVTLSGSRTGNALTDASGFYYFGNLPAGGNYTVTPSKSGFSFDSVSQTFNNLNGVPFVPFEAFTKISGRVTGINNTGVAGMTVKLSGYRALTRTTDSNGNYAFDNLPAGADYVVTPSKTGVTFNPASRNFNDLNAAQVANFQALVGITGKVKRAGTTSGISGVTVRLSGARTAATTTDANGFYTFANLPLGGNYTVTPSKTGISFDPPSKTFTNLKVGQTVSTASFIGTLTN